MAFMTGATVRNLPRYIEGIRRDKLDREQAQREEEAKRQKKLATDAAFEIYNLGTSEIDEDGLKSGLQQIVEKYRGLGAAEYVIPMAIQGARNFREKQYQDELKARDKERFDRETTIFNQGQAKAAQQKSDNHALSILQSGKALDREGNPIPFNKESILGNLSYGARQKYDQGVRDQEKHKADMDYKKAQTNYYNSAKGRSGKGGAKKTPFSEETKIYDYLIKQAYRTAGYTDSELGGVVDAAGNPVPQENINKLDDAVQSKIPLISQAMQEGMGFFQAVKATERLEELQFQKAVKDHVQKAMGSENPEQYLRALESQSPKVAEKVKAALMEAAKEKEKKKTLTDLSANYGDLIGEMNRQRKESDGYSRPISTLK